MTYTLVFRVTREVWDALEKGEKKAEYRDHKPFWTTRMERAIHVLVNDGQVEALFLEPPRWGEEDRRTRIMRYAVTSIGRMSKLEIPGLWRDYLTTPKVWAVELGRRVEP